MNLKDIILMLAIGPGAFALALWLFF